MECETCGYKSKCVCERADGIIRCEVCTNRTLNPLLSYVDDKVAEQLYEEGYRYPWEDDIMSIYINV